MADYCQDLIKWLKSDYLEHRSKEKFRKANYSVIEQHIYGNHQQSFHVKTKRLCRELIEAENKDDKAYFTAKLRFARYLVQELRKPQVINGKTGGNKAPMKDKASLAKLIHCIDPSHVETDCTAIKSENKKESVIKNDLYVLIEHPDKIKTIDEELLINLASDMLAARKPVSNSVEKCMELLEDILRGDVVLDGKDRTSALESLDTPEFAVFVGRVKPDYSKVYVDALGWNDTDIDKLDIFKAVFSKASDDSSLAETLIRVVADEEVEETLKGLENYSEEDGIKKLCNTKIDSELIKQYQKYLAGRQELDLLNDLQKDAHSLYKLTQGDKRFDNIFVPIIIDDHTGVGLFLIGKEYRSEYGLGYRQNEWQTHTTIVAVDHRLSNPCKSRKATEPKEPCDSNGYYKYNNKDQNIIYNPWIVTLEEWKKGTLGSDCIKTLFACYKRMGGHQEGRVAFDELPEAWPERFVRCFRKKQEPPLNDKWRNAQAEELGDKKTEIIPYR